MLVHFRVRVFKSFLYLQGVSLLQEVCMEGLCILFYFELSSAQFRLLSVTLYRIVVFFSVDSDLATHVFDPRQVFLFYEFLQLPLGLELSSHRLVLF